MRFKSQQEHMTDLTNKIDKLIADNKESVLKLVNKYKSVLEYMKPESRFPYYAYVLDCCVNDINKNHVNEKSDWKAWASLIVFKLYQENKLTDEKQISDILNEFMEFKKTEYNKYCEDIISVNEYERDRGFAYKFYFRKKKIK